MPEQSDAAELIAALPCAVELPQNRADYFARTGPLSAIHEDARRYPRFHLRTAAAISYRSTLPALPRSTKAERVYLKDISRSSVAFLHSEQLFPRERFEMLLADGTHWFVTVVRCLRRQDRCYEIAALLTA
ncbi:MAG TPA: hypothetical protein VGY55_20930 [Pirellulales bacterium]|jgi:hypothetical protein|nr:hypothetical protein [Pirellulales bacterium]